MTAAIDLNAIVHIALDDIAESPTNPRQHFDQEALQDLANSFGRVGVLEAALVRPRPREIREQVEKKLGIGGGPSYELVFGARRYRAAKIAGLKALPCTVRELSDDDVLEIQLIENLKRENLHPLEEADHITLLARTLTQEEIATRIGRDLSHVKRRLRISQLVDEVRALFLEGKLFVGHAELLAGIAKSLQVRAATRIMKGHLHASDAEFKRDGEVLTVKEAAEMLRTDFLLRLASAPFDTANVLLVPDAGACTVCPKRTGAQQELFAAAAPDESCTDPDCWKSKVDADWKRRVSEARDTGRKVLKNASEVFEKPRGFDAGRTVLKYDGDLVDVDREVWIKGKETTYRKALGKDLDASKLALARDHGGQAHDVITKKDLVEIAKRAGVEVDYNDRPRGTSTSSSSSSSRSTSKSPKVREQPVETEAKERAEKRVLAAIAAAATKRKLDDGFIRWIATRLVDVTNTWAVKERRGVEKLDPKKFAGGEIRGLVAEIIAGDLIDEGIDDPKERDRHFAHWGVSWTKIYAAAVDEVKTERAPKSSPPPKGTKPVAVVKKAKKGRA